MVEQNFIDNVQQSRVGEENLGHKNWGSGGPSLHSESVPGGEWERLHEMAAALSATPLGHWALRPFLGAIAVLCKRSLSTRIYSVVFYTVYENYNQTNCSAPQKYNITKLQSIFSKTAFSLHLVFLLVWSFNAMINPTANEILLKTFSQ